ncbi:MAG: sulfotransferase family protein [Phormidesmis sp.]
MLVSALDKTKLLSLTEWSTLAKRLNVKLRNDWQPEDYRKRRLIVNHDYRFVYCPIHKNASTSMMSALFSLVEGRKKQGLSNLSDLQIRIYMSLNHSLSSYTYASASKILSGDYFKFAIVRNPWARLVSTYANYFVRLPIEKGIISDMAPAVASLIYEKYDVNKHLDKITFKEFAEYVAVTKDFESNPHCVSQTQYLAGIGYDYIAKMESLNSDLLHIAEVLKLPIDMGRNNKTAYSMVCNTIDGCSRLTSSQIRYLEGGIPDYRKFYTPELIELVKDRYIQDVENFGYTF